MDYFSMKECFTVVVLFLVTRRNYICYNLFLASKETDIPQNNIISLSSKLQFSITLSSLQNTYVPQIDNLANEVRYKVMVSNMTAHQKF